MGRIDHAAAVAAARRFAERRSQQAALGGNQEAADESNAKAMERRRSFLLASERVFFESIFDGSDLLPVRYLAMGQIAARAVGRIYLPPSKTAGSGFATGFMVAPGLLLTNHHVLPTSAMARAATLTMDAEDGVDGLPSTPRVFLLDPSRAFVSDQLLDFALVAVRPRASDGTPIASYGYLRMHGGTGKIVRDEYATIIQHPNGRQKHIAARNNQIKVYIYDHDLPESERAENSFIYYSTDTLKGSSGSPVLSDQWFVVALHRRGVPRTRIVRGEEMLVRLNGKLVAEDDPEEVIAYESNEGVRISHILRRLEFLSQNGELSVQIAAQQVFRSVCEAAGTLADGPFSRQTHSYGPLLARTAPQELLAPALEVVRRSLAKFSNAGGYDPQFLGLGALELPRFESPLERELARRTDEPDSYWLPFRHFSTCMHARRRTPVVAAVNIDGGRKPEGGMPNRPQWSYDPRISEDHQPDDSIFSSLVQRGHFAAREYVFWGDDEEEVREADVHSFTLTNACPQIDSFNGQNGEWFQVERRVMAGSKVEDLRISEFTGPIFRSDDPEYDSLRGPDSDAAVGTTIRIPLRFWKIVVWAENGELKHRAFILDQRSELEEAGPLELDLQAPEGVVKTTVRKIEKLTGLLFDGL